MNSTPTPAVRELWRSAKAVCFDVDSTVIQDEGIDVLAAFANVADRVAELTRNAMGGSVPFEVALRQRLEMIKPSRALIHDCLKRHPPRLTPGIADLIRRLSARNIPVWLVSGGFRLMIEPVAKQLGIPPEHVIANEILFGNDGSYAGFDRARPTSASGGKAKALAGLKQRFGYHPLVMVGDGVTDLEAKPPADLFIGFGGIAVRDRVKAEADWFITDFADLRHQLT